VTLDASKLEEVSLSEEALDAFRNVGEGKSHKYVICPQQFGA
jgi:hypothetical protein